MQRDTDGNQLWLNLIVFVYMGLGSVVTCVGNLATLTDADGALAQLATFVTGITFPAIAAYAIMAGFRHQPDVRYAIYLYLGYNAVTSCIFQNWASLFVDLICYLYFLFSNVAGDLWPDDDKEWSRNMTCLSCLAAAGIAFSFGV